MKFLKFLRTPFLQNPSGDCLFTSGGCFRTFLMLGISADVIIGAVIIGALVIIGAK